LTLALSVVAPWGIWLASDHRLTRIPGGELLTDTSKKHLALRCTNGGVLVGYTGVGRVDGVDVSVWARDILKGESRSVNDTLQLLCAQSTEWLGPFAYRYALHHTFLFGAFLGGRAWGGVITNMQPEPPHTEAPPRRQFVLAAQPFSGGRSAVAGGGQLAISDTDGQLLNPKR
jgi:hypothetical protein